LRPSEATSFRDLYLVYELMDTDLYQARLRAVLRCGCAATKRNTATDSASHAPRCAPQVIRSPQPLSEAHTQYFMWQLLCGLRYMHAAGVIHRDLNPANLLVNAACDLKIADFGLARAAAPPGEPMSAYVVTRWYRAPELLLAAVSYGAPVDTWAAGCVLAELLGRRALFPGRDAAHQLSLVLGVIGTPEEGELRRCASPAGAAFAARLPRAARVSMAHLYPDAAPAAVALLDALLVFDPCARCSAEGALKHPYLEGYADCDQGDAAAEAYSAQQQPAPPRSDCAFAFEAQRLEESQARALVLAEVDALAHRNAQQARHAQSAAAAHAAPQEEGAAGALARAMASLSAASPDAAAAVAAARAAHAAAFAACTPERVGRSAAAAAAAAAAVISAAGAAAAGGGEGATRAPEARPTRSPEPPFPAPPKQGRSEGASQGVVLQPRANSRSPPPPGSPHGALAGSPQPKQLSTWPASAAA
jgi:hypothetical protein